MVRFPLNSQKLLCSSLPTGVKGGKGPADALFIDAIPVPIPGSNQALVKIKAFGLNRMDLLQREGWYPVPPQAPSTLGVEFSGIIESFGDYSGKNFTIGDEVFGLAYGGQSILFDIYFLLQYIVLLIIHFRCLCGIHSSICCYACS